MRPREAYTELFVWKNSQLTQGPHLTRVSPQMAFNREGQCSRLKTVPILNRLVQTINNKWRTARCPPPILLCGYNHLAFMSSQDVGLFAAIVTLITFKWFLRLMGRDNVCIQIRLIFCSMKTT